MRNNFGVLSFFFGGLHELFIAFNLVTCALVGQSKFHSSWIIDCFGFHKQRKHFDVLCVDWSGTARAAAAAADQTNFELISPAAAAAIIYFPRCAALRSQPLF
jgi:hypothetical protein